LEGFLKKVASNSLEVVAEEIAERELLLLFEILTAPEQQPAGFLEEVIRYGSAHSGRRRVRGKD